MPLERRGAFRVQAGAGEAVRHDLQARGAMQRLTKVAECRQAPRPRLAVERLIVGTVFLRGRRPRLRPGQRHRALQRRVVGRGHRLGRYSPPLSVRLPAEEGRTPPVNFRPHGHEKQKPQVRLAAGWRPFQVVGRVDQPYHDLGLLGRPGIPREELKERRPGSELQRIPLGLTHQVRDPRRHRAIGARQPEVSPRE